MVNAVGVGKESFDEKKLRGAKVRASFTHSVYNGKPRNEISRLLPLAKKEGTANAGSGFQSVCGGCTLSPNDVEAGVIPRLEWEQF